MAIRISKDPGIKLKIHALLSKITDYANKSYQIASDDKYYYIWSDDFKKILKTVKAMGFEVAESPIALVDTKYENIFPTFEKKDSFISKRVIVRIDQKDVSSVSQYLFESEHDKFHITKAANYFYFLVEDAPLFWTHSIMFFSKFVVFTERNSNIFVRSNQEYPFSDILTKDQAGYFIIEDKNSIFIAADSFKFSYDVVKFNFDLDKIKSETKDFKKINVYLSLKMNASTPNVSLWRLSEGDVDRIPDLIDMLTEAEKDCISIGSYEMSDGDMTFFVKVSPKIFNKEVYAKIVTFFNGDSYYLAYDNIRVYVKNGYRVFPDVDSRAIFDVTNTSSNYITVFDGGDNHFTLISLKENCFVPLTRSYTITSMRFKDVLESIYSSIHFTFDPITEKARKESASLAPSMVSRASKDKGEDVIIEATKLNPMFETVSKGGIRGSIWGKIYDEYKHPTVYARACLFAPEKIKKHDENFSKYISFLNSDDIYNDKKVKTIVSELQANIRTTPKHFYFYFMRELASKLQDSLLLQQQKEFLFNYLNVNSMQDVDFPPFVTPHSSNDEIDKDSFAATIWNIINHKSVPNEDIRYVLYKFGELALAFNNEQLTNTVKDTHAADKFHELLLRKANDRLNLVKSGKPEDTEWAKFLAAQRTGKNSVYMESYSQDTSVDKIKFVVDQPLNSSKDESHVKFVKDILMGGNPEKIVSSFISKKASRETTAAFFSPITENIRKLNVNELYAAISKHYPFNYDPAKHFDVKSVYPIACMYACMYAMTGDIEGLSKAKAVLCKILSSSNDEITYYHVLATVANICGPEFADDLYKSIPGDNENNMPVVKVYLDCTKLAILYGSGKSVELYNEVNAFLEKVEANLKGSKIRAPLYIKNVFTNLFVYCSSLTMGQRQSVISKCIEISTLPQISGIDNANPTSRITHITIAVAIMHAIMNAGSLKDRTMRAFLGREEATLRQEIIASKI